MKWDKNDISGEPPAPRWRHSAAVYDKTKIVYFGGYASNTERFNDVWLLDAKLKTWSCLHPGGSDRKGKRGDAGHRSVASAAPTTEAHRGPHRAPPPASAEAIPQPRGSHSGTVIGKHLYVFGGYGGAGFSRRDFNDLHRFDLEERRWEKLNPKGTPPQPRAGHAAVAAEDKVLVFGGTSSTEQFNDLHVYEPATETWTATDCNFGTPRWNAALVAVAAVPHWQVFLFGGATGDFSESARGMQFDNSITVLDTGRMRWNSPKVLGNPPCGRSDTPAVYDSKRGRLIVFGGWANRWYGDLHTLDVQSMVGPPYAILDMSPKLGANTGGQEVVIKGMGFQDTGPINVQVRGCVPRARGVRVGREWVDARLLPLPHPSSHSRTLIYPSPRLASAVLDPQARAGGVRHVRQLGHDHVPDARVFPHWACRCGGPRSRRRQRVHQHVPEVFLLRRGGRVQDRRLRPGPHSRRRRGSGHLPDRSVQGHGGQRPRHRRR